ncbi:MAG: hypothetical protein V5A55_06860 [Halovenus sp.]
MTASVLPLSELGRISLSSHGGNSDGLVYLALGFLVGLAFIYVGAKKWRVGQLIRNTATERVRSAAVGRTEISGVCRDAGVVYDTPYGDGECVYRHWEVEEYQESTDPDDNTSEWVVVDSGTDVAPFFIEDDTGRMLVDTTDAPNFEISDENSYSTTVDRDEEPPPAVQSFAPDSSGLLESVAGDVSPGDAMSSVPGMGNAGGMFGDATISEMMSADGPPAERDADARDPKQAMQQYFDDDVLDGNGQLREDVTEAELAAAMNADMEDMGPGDLFGEGAAGGTDGRGEETGDDSDESAGPPGTDGTQQGTPDVVQELGGTGSAGAMGTGTSLGQTLIDGALYKASGGRLGSAVTGGGLLGGANSSQRYTRRRYSHEVLPVDEEVYIFGEAQPRDDASGSNAERLKLGEEEATGQFIISDRDESGIIKHYSRRGPLYVVIGLVVSAGSLGGLLLQLGIA